MLPNQFFQKGKNVKRNSFNYEQEKKNHKKKFYFKAYNIVAVLDKGEHFFIMSLL